jgi:hypothetical protein
MKVYELSFNGLNLIDVQSSFEHRVGFNLIFSILLDFVTVAIEPHSSPIKMRFNKSLKEKNHYIEMIVLNQKHTVFQRE